MKPMLAVEAPKDLTFPLYASPKLDGIRCVINSGLALSRQLKLIPNRATQERFGHEFLHGLDGELIVGDPWDHNAMQNTSSGVMSYDGDPRATFYVFDYWTAPTVPFQLRHHHIAQNREVLEAMPGVKVLEQRMILHSDALAQYENECLEQGYEGLILRGPDSLYKYGRSTAREGYLLKLKRFTDAEAVVTGFEELMHNANTLQTDALGYAKRASCQDGLVPMDTLGALIVSDVTTGIEFRIGTGYTAAQRKDIWKNRHKVLGSIVKYKHFEVGVKTAPRFPVWLGFRSPLDL